LFDVSIEGDVTGKRIEAAVRNRLMIARSLEERFEAQ
jgi:hypothetical protein